MVYLFIFGKATHDSRVHDAIEQHGQRVDGKALICLILVDHGQNLLIGALHGLDGVLQRRQQCLGTEAELYYKQRERGQK